MGTTEESDIVGITDQPLHTQVVALVLNFIRVCAIVAISAALTQQVIINWEWFDGLSVGSILGMMGSIIVVTAGYAVLALMISVGYFAMGGVWKKLLGMRSGLMKIVIVPLVSISTVFMLLCLFVVADSAYAIIDITPGFSYPLPAPALYAMIMIVFFTAPFYAMPRKWWNELSEIKHLLTD